MPAPVGADRADSGFPGPGVTAPKAYRERPERGALAEVGGPPEDRKRFPNKKPGCGGGTPGFCQPSGAEARWLW